MQSSKTKGSREQKTVRVRVRVMCVSNVVCFEYQVRSIPLRLKTPCLSVPPPPFATLIAHLLQNDSYALVGATCCPRLFRITGGAS